MKVICDIVLTIDNFDEDYASWKGRTLTVMGDYLKMSQPGLQPHYFDTIYLFEDTGILIGFTYGNPLNKCYITTQDGLESDCYVDAFPYIFNDMDRTFIIVKRSYKNIDLRRQVIGLNILDASTLSPIDSLYTWPIWESIESIQNGAVLIKKKEDSYGMATIDKFPSCNLVNNAFSINQDSIEPNVYFVRKSGLRPEILKFDFTKKLSKIKAKK